MNGVWTIKAMHFDSRRNGNETKNRIAWNGAAAFG
jgi:hypothetical protein